MNGTASFPPADGQDTDVLSVGTRVLNRYVLEERIGGGGMGEVWRARHMILDCPVAIKASLSREARSLQRFEQEARIGASLAGPNLCRVFDAGTYRGYSLLVMEYLQGQTLAERLLFGSRLLPTEALAIVTQVARGLSRAHAAGVIHRDLKPSNIFLERGERVRLLDFGVAKDWKAEQTSSGDFLGTPQYLSPEQARDPRGVGPASDLWSLALITYECVVGKRVFAASSPAELVDHVCHRALPRPSAHAPVPAEFDAWFAKATQRDPKKRFPTAAAFAEALTNALQSAPAPQVDSTRTASLMEKLDAGRRPNRWQLVSLGAVTAVVVLGAFLVARPASRATGPHRPTNSTSATRESASDPSADQRGRLEHESFEPLRLTTEDPDEDVEKALEYQPDRRVQNTSDERPQRASRTSLNGSPQLVDPNLSGVAPGDEASTAPTVESAHAPQPAGTEKASLPMTRQRPAASSNTGSDARNPFSYR